MHAQDFDTLSRKAGRGISRRGMLTLGAAAALPGFANALGSTEVAAGHRKRKRRRRRRDRDRCVPLTPVFEQPPATCASSEECCDNGLCCTFNDGPQVITGCYDLRTRVTTCGLSCDALDNCLNYDPVRQCVNGACVAA